MGIPKSGIEDVVLQDSGYHKGSVLRIKPVRVPRRHCYVVDPYHDGARFKLFLHYKNLVAVIYPPGLSILRGIA